MDVALVADRFVHLSKECAFDLATGERVLLLIHPSASREMEQRRSEQCAALCGVWHRNLAECLDFGGLGAEHWFLAFRIGESDSPACTDERWHRIAGNVSRFLTACQIEPSILPPVLTDSRGRRLRRPSRSSHSMSEANAGAPRTWERNGSNRWFGIRLAARDVLSSIVEHLTLTVAPGITRLPVAAPPGSGGRTLLRTCAREARRRGYVPMSAAAFRWMERQPGESLDRWMQTLGRRSIVVLHDGRRERLHIHHDAERALLRLGTYGLNPRVIIELVSRSDEDVSLQLRPLPHETLVAMVVSSDKSRAVAERIGRAARACHGHPGPFIGSLIRLFGPGRRYKPAPYMVHEAVTQFRPNTRRLTGRRGGIGRRAAAARLLSAGAHIAIQAAAVLATRGRHAAAERALHQAHAAAMRRGLWLPAGDLALATGRLLVSRGRNDDGTRAFEEAIDCYGRGQCAEGIAAAVAHLGWSRLQDTRIDESESSFRSALSATTQLDRRVAVGWISCALAVCLWWQGRIDEAQAALGPEGDDNSDREDVAESLHSGWPSASHVRVWRACVGARIGLTLGNPCLARSHLDRAAMLVARERLHAMRALVRRVEARWHAAVGDVSGLRTAASEAARLAREARQPLERLRALAGYLEGCARLDVKVEPEALRRLERAPLSVLPRLLALRIRVAIAPWRRTAPLSALVTECEARGIEVLRKIAEAAAAEAASDRKAKRPAMYEDVIDVLTICQEEEPSEALRRVADIVKQRTRAAVVEFAASNNAMSVSVPSGARSSTVACRSAESNLAIEPTATDRGTEAAVPLRSGGQVVGALAARWIGPLPLETGRLMGLLTAIAAAAAPCLQAVTERQRSIPTGPMEAEILGESAAIRELRQAVVRAADAPFPVLIQGESGSGKELVARAIHRASRRRSRVFCALNCAALPDDLLEAELFGHARGAFTGAVTDRPGLFEEADGGMLFLDEVGELTPRGQAKLLRAIQEGEIKRVGETHARKVDARIVAATNRPLEQEVVAGRFRRDLRYRLDVIRLHVPPLRDRPEDIPLLVAIFWRQATDRVGSRAVLSAAIHAALARYDWPGNVRELQNVLAALAVTAPRRGTVASSALPATIAGNAMRATATTLEEARRLFEERYVRAALARAGGHRGRAAAELGLTRQGLAKLMGRLGVALELGGQAGTAANGAPAS